MNAGLKLNYNSINIRTPYYPGGREIIPECGGTTAIDNGIMISKNGPTVKILLNSNKN